MRSMRTHLRGGIMKKITSHFLACVLLIPLSGSAEILALLNYESKPNDSLKDLKMPFGTQGRKEGIAIIDVDPESENYGNILVDIPLPPDLVGHHVFYNRDATKIYLTALGRPELRVIDMTANPSTTHIPILSRGRYPTRMSLRSMKASTACCSAAPYVHRTSLIRAKKLPYSKPAQANF